MYGTIKQKIEKSDRYVYAVAVEHFGVKAAKVSPQITPMSRRKHSLEELHKQQRILRARYKKAPDAEKGRINDLQVQLHTHTHNTNLKHRPNIHTTTTQTKTRRSKLLISFLEMWWP